MDKIKWEKTPFTDVNGEWEVEKFPVGHIAAGKERARYLITPSAKWVADNPPQKSPEEKEVLVKQQYANATAQDKMDMIAERLGLK